MSTDLHALTDQQLQNLLSNHRRKGAVRAPLYLATLAEYDKRKGKGLEFEKSFKVIQAAARERRFVAYKELADASGATWSRVHLAMGEHLGRLVEYADRQDWPMLSAIVVNKPNVTSGRMEPDTLQGFVTAARQLGHEVTDEPAFLKEQQERVFEWAELEAADDEA